MEHDEHPRGMTNQSNEKNRKEISRIRRQRDKYPSLINSRNARKRSLKTSKPQIHQGIQSPADTRFLLSLDGENKNTRFRNSNSFLRFVIPKPGSDSRSYIIADDHKKHMGQTFETKNIIPLISSVFGITGMTLGLDMKKYAKLLVFAAHKTTSVDLVAYFKISVEKILTTSTHCFAKRMAVVYFIHLVIKIDIANIDLAKGRFHRVLEDFISDPAKDIFRKLVQEVNFSDKQDLFSLRYRWDNIFSPKSLRNIDRKDFWWKESLKTDIKGMNSEELLKSIKIYKFPDQGPYTNDDDVATFNIIIKVFLRDDWLKDFCITREDNQRFMDKYLTEPTRGLVATHFYSNSVFMTPTQQGIIDLAKEAFYLENILGKGKVFNIIGALLGKKKYATYRATKPSNPCGSSHKNKLVKFVVMHAILCAETTLSYYKDFGRKSFCNEFLRYNFILHFARLFKRIKDKEALRNMYLMTRYWKPFLHQNFVTELDEFMWTENKVSCLMSTALKVKAEVDTSTESSSEDEVDNDSKIADAGETEVAQPKTNYVQTFESIRYDRWTKYFTWNENDCTNLRIKYDFSKFSKNKTAFENSFDFAVETFRKTTFDSIPSIDECKILGATKEAFFVQIEFGYGAVHEVTKFLVQSMKEGFNFCKSMESKAFSQLLAFLIIHFVLAVESVEPIIVPNVTERSYKKAILCEDAFSVAKTLFKTINDVSKKAMHYTKSFRADYIKEKLKFLASTWILSREDAISSKINKLYKANYKFEGVFIKDIIEYVQKKYYRDTELFNSEKAAFRARYKRKFHATRTGNSDSEDERLKQNSFGEEKVVIITNKSSKVSVNRKSHKQQNSFLKKKAKLSLSNAMESESLFVPDVIKKIPTVPKPKRNVSEEITSKDVDFQSKSKLPRNSNTSLSMPSPLLGINGQPIHQSGSKCEKAMEEMRKMLRERNGDPKYTKPIIDDTTAQVQDKASHSAKEIKLKNFESQDFVDNLLTSTLTDFEIVYNEKGLAEVKFIHVL